MNRPRSLAPADPPAITATLGSSISFDERVGGGSKTESIAPPNGTVRETRSTTDLTTMGDAVTNSFSSLGLQSNDTKVAAATEHFDPQPTTDFEIVPKHEGIAQAPNEAKEVPQAGNGLQDEPVAVEYDGDPLGVMKSMLRKTEVDGLDFAAFASQNAFKDR